MLAWQRRARTLIAAVAVIVSVTVFLTTHRRQPPPAGAGVARVDPAAVIESSGAFVRDVKGDRERFRGSRAPAHLLERHDKTDRCEGDRRSRQHVFQREGR
jgi:hypothetical protein